MLKIWMLLFLTAICIADGQIDTLEIIPLEIIFITSKFMVDLKKLVWSHFVDNFDMLTIESAY